MKGRNAARQNNMGGTHVTKRRLLPPSVVGNTYGRMSGWRNLSLSFQEADICGETALFRIRLHAVFLMPTLPRQSYPCVTPQKKKDLAFQLSP
jgi:hypothetical protein